TCTSTLLSAPSSRASASEAAADSSWSSSSASSGFLGGPRLPNTDPPLGAHRLVERHSDHEQRLDVRVAVAGELDRGRDHLLADRAELHRHEDAGELALGKDLRRRMHRLEQSPAAAPAPA